MLTKINSVAHLGLVSTKVTVEVDVAAQGFPAFNIVGLPSKAVEEARERVKTAIVNSGFKFPDKRLTVNLAPADFVKDGSCYDLPIALGILLSSGGFEPAVELSKALFYGELSLNGEVRHSRGVLLVAIFAFKEGFRDVYIPAESSREAQVVDRVKCRPVPTLLSLVNYLEGKSPLLSAKQPLPRVQNYGGVVPDFGEIVGQEGAKRALTIAASGGHNLIMTGPPGSGKTLLARALPSILPPLTPEEALEVTQVYSAGGFLRPGEGLVRVRPFRSPHHSTSLAGLIGGGSRIKAGEISLAHQGVLFLDEMAEFSRSLLEALRQPLEDGVVVISRAAGRVEYPARFMLVASVNPCPCGYLNHPKRSCRCSIREIDRYKRRLSGPILDRIDLHLFVPYLEAEKLTANSNHSESSEVIRKRVVKARQLQAQRLRPFGMYANAQMQNKQVRQFCALNPTSTRLLRLAIDRHSLSPRSYFRILKVARTIADLADSPDILTDHLAEALEYRSRAI